VHRTRCARTGKNNTFQIKKRAIETIQEINLACIVQQDICSQVLGAMRAEHQVGHKQTCKKFIKQLLHGVDSGKLLDTDAEFRDPFGLYNNRDGAGKRRAHFVAKPIGFNM
jgi:hypothetical protein